MDCPATKISHMDRRRSGCSACFSGSCVTWAMLRAEPSWSTTCLAERYPCTCAELARELRRHSCPTLSCPQTRPFASNFKAATTTIPIVTLTADPMPADLYQALHDLAAISPASVSMQEPKFWANAWRFSWTSPQNCPMLVTLHRNASWEGSSGTAAREAGGRAGITLAGEPMNSVNEQEYKRVFNSLKDERVDGILVSDESEQFTYRRLLVELAAKTPHSCNLRVS